MRTLTFNRIIGSGAMGTVYHAELKTPGGFVRPCAVKVMKGTGPDRDQFMTRMRDEARLLGMLQDEQVLGVSELVNIGHYDAVIMDYVEGVDLLDLVRVQRVPPRALCELGAEIAGTLYRAHRARHPSTGEPLNVIHRDIKPANVMVTPRGGVRLLDFGVARAAFSDRESQTQGLVLGTLNYFPPEILAGQEPTQAVDIYGLGLTLWECASGKDWGSPQANQKRFERRVDQRLSEIAAEYKELVPVMRSILQWDPDLRPDGGVVERALLHAASLSPGDGLRVWARDIVPPMIDARDQAGRARHDDLVGKTLEIRGASAPEIGSARSVETQAPRLEERPAPPPAPAPSAGEGRRRPPQRQSSLVWMLLLGVLLGGLVGLAVLAIVFVLAMVVYI